MNRVNGRLNEQVGDRVVSSAVVVAVVPLFSPGAGARDGLRALAAQVDHLLLIDDGSPTDQRDFVGSIHLGNTSFYRSSRNEGIAAALNRGIEIALDNFCPDFILTADQDSVFESDFVSESVAAAQELRATGIALAATAAGTVNGVIHDGSYLFSEYRTTRETTQSGMLYVAELFKRLGMFDESFFIDCVDTDHIIRAARQGFQTVLVPSSRMSHSMGERVSVRLPFFFAKRDRNLSFHTPVRRYYITRNRVRVALRHGRAMPGWATRQLGQQILWAAADFVYGSNRREQLIATCVGVVHGLVRRGGKIDPWLEDLLIPSRAVS